MGSSVTERVAHLFIQQILRECLLTRPGIVLSAGDSAVNRADPDLPSKVGQDAPELWLVLLPESATAPG